MMIYLFFYKTRLQQLKCFSFLLEVQVTINSDIVVRSKGTLASYRLVSCCIFKNEPVLLIIKTSVPSKWKPNETHFYCRYLKV